MKLVDKDKVISILSKKIADIELDMKCGFLKKRKGTNNILVLKHIISLIDTIEVKDTDAFIEKACDWLKENKDKYLYNTGGRGEYIPTCSGKMIDEFRNHMKGE